MALLSPPSSPLGGFICPFPPLVLGPRDALMAPCSLSVRYLNGNRPWKYGCSGLARCATSLLSAARVKCRGPNPSLELQTSPGRGESGSICKFNIPHQVLNLFTLQIWSRILMQMESNASCTGNLLSRGSLIHAKWVQASFLIAHLTQLILS